MRRKPIDAEEIKIFVSEFSQLLEKQAGLTPDKLKMFKVDTLDQRDTLFVMAEFSGNMEGKAFVSVDETTACLLAEQISKVQSGQSRSFDRASEKVKALVLELSQQYFKGVAAALKEKAGRICEVSEADFCESGEARIKRQYAMIPFTVSGLSQIHLSLNLQAVKKVDDSGKKRIVVIDNSVSTRDLLENILEKANYHVVGEFSNGAAALGKINELTPQMVLLNIDIPGVEGTRMLASVRAACPSAKVVIMTATADKSVIMQCLQNGAATCILKPFEPPRLVETVTKILYLP